MWLSACAPVPGAGAKGASPRPPPAIAEVRGGLADLGAIELVPITRGDRAASRLWNDLLQAYHYLGGRGRCAGRRSATWCRARGTAGWGR